MRRRSLTELASNPDLISGIYNYCDRWCERCPLTSRCLVYATEQVGHNGAIENHDNRNEAFWHKLSAILVETREMPAFVVVFDGGIALHVEEIAGHVISPGWAHHTQALLRMGQARGSTWQAFI